MVLLTEFLLWCAVINMGLLTFWLVMLLAAHDRIYRFHTRFFRLSGEHFDLIHYQGMAIYKLMIFFFNIVPWIVLKFMVAIP